MKAKEGMTVRQLIDTLIEQYAECGDAIVEVVIPAGKGTPEYRTIAYVTETYALQLTGKEE